MGIEVENHLNRRGISVKGNIYQGALCSSQCSTELEHGKDNKMSCFVRSIAETRRLISHKLTCKVKFMREMGHFVEGWFQRKWEKRNFGKRIYNQQIQYFLLLISIGCGVIWCSFLESSEIVTCTESNSFNTLK